MQSWIRATLVAGLAVFLSAGSASLCRAQRGPAWRVAQGDAKKRIRPAQRQPNRRPSRSLNDMVVRLMQLPPEQRRAVLRNSPRLRNLRPEQRRRLLARLRDLDKMPAEQRELLVQRYQLFSRLGPEQQSRARALYRQWAGLPRERRLLMTKAIRKLREMPPSERSAMLASEAAIERFSESERKMLKELVELVGSARKPEPE